MHEDSSVSQCHTLMTGACARYCKAAIFKWFYTWVMRTRRSTAPQSQLGSSVLGKGIYAEVLCYNPETAEQFSQYSQGSAPQANCA